MFRLFNERLEEGDICSQLVGFRYKHIRNNLLRLLLFILFLCQYLILYFAWDYILK